MENDVVSERLMMLSDQVKLDNKNTDTDGGMSRYQSADLPVDVKAGCLSSFVTIARYLIDIDDCGGCVLIPRRKENCCRVNIERLAQNRNRLANDGYK